MRLRPIACGLVAVMTIGVGVGVHGQGTPAARPAAAPKAKASADRVLGTVNGDPIHESEVRDLLERFSIPAGEEKRAYDSAMEMLVNTRVLEQFLKAQKITVTEAEIAEVVSQYEQQAKQSGSDLATELNNSDTSLDQLREMITRRLQWQKYVMPRATDAELRKYAEANKETFNGTQVRASHLLLRVDPDAPAEEKAKARERLLAIKKEIESKAISFADAANKYSEDPGNQQTPSGGDLNYFPRKGQFIEEFSAAAFALKKGEISDPVETEYGLHLIQVTDRREGQPVDFDRLKNEILNHYASDLQAQIVAEQRKKAEVKIEPMPPGLVQTEPVAAPAPAPAASSPAPATAKPANTPATKPATAPATKPAAPAQGAATKGR